MVPNVKKRPSVGVFPMCAAMLFLATAALAASNVPSINQVYQAAHSGHLAQAEEMTREVLHAYPDSARAHYVLAQILAAEGRTSEARGYLESAERLKPGLPFASPESVAKLQRRLNNEGQLPARVQPGASRIHWGWLLAGAIVLFLLWRALNRPRPASSNYGDRSINAGGGGLGPVAPSPGYGGGGFLSSVLAGLGFGAAAAAGQRVMDRLLGGEQRDESTQPEIPQQPSASEGLGGDSFGVRPGDNSSGGWEDSGDQPGPSPDSGNDIGAGDSDGGWDDSSGGGGDMDV